MRLSLAYSPCPNDTFIFHAIAAGLIGRVPDGGPATDEVVPSSEEGLPFEFDVRLADIETLNSLTAAGAIDVAKVSYAAYGHIAHEYVLLRSGGALGRGVGPLVVARDPALDLAGARVAIPGGRTTANLLLRLLRTDIDLVEMRYDAIMPSVAAGDVDAGLIIHESRFTYRDHGLHSLVDLGAWWEREHGHLVPLGAIVARRSLGSAAHAALTRLIRASVESALAQPLASADYVAEHAQEMTPGVRQRHIDLYVNRFSLDVGPQGEAAVRALLTAASARGLFPEVRGELYAPGGVDEASLPAPGAPLAATAGRR